MDQNESEETSVKSEDISNGGFNSDILLSAELSGLYLGRYRVVRTLGEGGHGKVKLAMDVKTGMQVALKLIAKESLLSPAHADRLRQEIRVLRLLNHPHIVKLYDVVETEHKIVIAMEYIPGGELFDYIMGQKRVKEALARRIFRQLLSAVCYCHKNFIIHRDLKPENLLLDHRRNIKVVDFGFTTLFDPKIYRDTFCGSPFYAAPEMVTYTNYVGPEVDVWSLGVILFTMLAGYPPFKDKSFQVVKSLICKGEYTIPEWFSQYGADLTKKMLTVDIKNRATIVQVLNHPWISEGFGEPPEIFFIERPLHLGVNDINEECLHRVALFVFDPEEIRKMMLKGETGPGVAIYWLIKERMEKDVDYKPMKSLKLYQANSDYRNRINSLKSAKTATTPISIQAPIEIDNLNNNSLSQKDAVVIVTPEEKSKNNPGSGPDEGFLNSNLNLTTQSIKPVVAGAILRRQSFTATAITLPPLQEITTEAHTQHETRSESVESNKAPESQTDGFNALNSRFVEGSLRNGLSPSQSSGFSIQRLSGNNISSTASTITRTLSPKVQGESPRNSLDRPTHERRRSFPHIMLRAFQLMHNKKSRRPSEKPIAEQEVPKQTQKTGRRKSLSGPAAVVMQAKRKLSGQYRIKSIPSPTDPLNTSTDNASSAISSENTTSDFYIRSVNNTVTQMSSETTSIKTISQITTEIEKALKKQVGFEFVRHTKEDDQIGAVASVMQFFESRSRRNSTAGRDSISGTSMSPNLTKKRTHSEPGPEVTWKVTTPDTDFEIRVMKIPGTKMNGIVFHRLKGSAYDYQTCCSALMCAWKI